MTHGTRDGAVSPMPIVVRKADHSGVVAPQTGSTILEPQQRSATLLFAPMSSSTAEQAAGAVYTTNNETEAEKIVRELVKQFLRPPARVSQIFPCW